MNILSTVITLLALATTPTEEDFLERMSREHAGDLPLPSSMALEGAAGESVDSQTVQYAELDGTAIEGYLARPASGEPKAAMIVIHEWWGLNDNIRSMANLFAAEGWAALAVDLYEGESASDPAQARSLMQKAGQSRERLQENLRQARRWLADELGVERVGVIGWCFGGGWSLGTALLLGDEIDASVVYYGWVTTDPEELASLTAPVMGHFGAEDSGIPLDGVRQFEAALETVGKSAGVFIYDGAAHAFANPSGTRFNEEAALAAWERTLAFLHENLDG